MADENPELATAINALNSTVDNLNSTVKVIPVTLDKLREQLAKTLKENNTASVKQILDSNKDLTESLKNDKTSSKSAAPLSAEFFAEIYKKIGILNPEKKEDITEKERQQKIDKEGEKINLIGINEPTLQKLSVTLKKSFKQALQEFLDDNPDAFCCNEGPPPPVPPAPRTPRTRERKKVPERRRSRRPATEPSTATELEYAASRAEEPSTALAPSTATEPYVATVPSIEAQPDVVTEVPGVEAQPDVVQPKQTAPQTVQEPVAVIEPAKTPATVPEAAPEKVTAPQTVPEPAAAVEPAKTPATVPETVRVEEKVTAPQTIPEPAAAIEPTIVASTAVQKAAPSITPQDILDVLSQIQTKVPAIPLPKPESIVIPEAVLPVLKEKAFTLPEIRKIAQNQLETASSTIPEITDTAKSNAEVLQTAVAPSTVIQPEQITAPTQVAQPVTELARRSFFSPETEELGNEKAQSPNQAPIQVSEELEREREMLRQFPQGQGVQDTTLEVVGVVTAGMSFLRGLASSAAAAAAEARALAAAASEAVKTAVKTAGAATAAGVVPLAAQTAPPLGTAGQSPITDTGSSPGTVNEYSTAATGSTPLANVAPERATNISQVAGGYTFKQGTDMSGLTNGLVNLSAKLDELIGSMSKPSSDGPGSVLSNVNNSKSTVTNFNNYMGAGDEINTSRNKTEQKLFNYRLQY